MSKEFQKGFKQGFALGTKIGHELGQQGCGSTDIEDILKNSISHLAAAPTTGDAAKKAADAAKPTPVTGTKPAPTPKGTLSETDPKAKSLGYKNDSKQVDEKKYIKHNTAQNCGKCVLYQGETGNASGGCPIFNPYTVSASGWCRAYNKKG